MMRKLIKSLLKSRFPYSPVITVTVNKDALRHNLNEFRKITGRTPVAPVLKSNAYGHGLIQTARILEKENVPLLMVDSYFEALALRHEGIKTPLLIMGYTPSPTI